MSDSPSAEMFYFLDTRGQIYKAAVRKTAADSAFVMVAENIDDFMNKDANGNVVATLRDIVLDRAMNAANSRVME